MLQEMIYFEISPSTRYRFLFYIDDEIIKNISMRYVYNEMNEKFPGYVKYDGSRKLIFEYFYPSISEQDKFLELMRNIHEYMNSIKNLLKK